LGLALMQVANGRQQDAMAQLERLEGNAAPADLGLAYALAGSPQRAIDLLEPAARSMGATARVRQNLALAYAFGGDWQRAKTIAAQDVSPAELPTRMSHWASLASRTNAPDQVAAMLGVSPAADAGQPTRVALNMGPPAVIQAPQEAQAVEFAAAEPVAVPEPVASQPVAFAAVRQPVETAVDAAPVPVATAPARLVFAEAAPPAPVRPAIVEPAPAPAAAPITEAVTAPPPVAWAEAQPVEIPAPVAAPAPVEAPAAEYAELETAEWGRRRARQRRAAEGRARRRARSGAGPICGRGRKPGPPDPVVMRVASRPARALAPLVSKALRGALPGTRTASGQYVGQIGAFSSAANAARAWQTYETKYGLRAETPVTMTLDHQGRLLHRVAISGFGKRGDAAQACRVIQTRGGECFVRINAGDSAIDWAARYASRD
jgi:hypothetical protein